MRNYGQEHLRRRHRRAFLSDALSHQLPTRVSDTPQAFQGCNHILPPGECSAACVRAALSPSRKPHDDGHGQKTEDHFGDQRDDPEAWTVAPFDAQDQPVDEEADQARYEETNVFTTPWINSITGRPSSVA